MSARRLATALLKANKTYQYQAGPNDTLEIITPVQPRGFRAVVATIQGRDEKAIESAERMVKHLNKGL